MTTHTDDPCHHLKGELIDYAALQATHFDKLDPTRVNTFLELQDTALLHVFREFNMTLNTYIWHAKLISKNTDVVNSSPWKALETELNMYVLPFLRVKHDLMGYYPIYTGLDVSKEFDCRVLRLTKSATSQDVLVPDMLTHHDYFDDGPMYDQALQTQIQSATVMVDPLSRLYANSVIHWYLHSILPIATDSVCEHVVDDFVNRGVPFIGPERTIMIKDDSDKTKVTDEMIACFNTSFAVFRAFPTANTSKTCGAYPITCNDIESCQLRSMYVQTQVPALPQRTLGFTTADSVPTEELQYVGTIYSSVQPSKILDSMLNQNIVLLPQSAMFCFSTFLENLQTFADQTELSALVDGIVADAQLQSTIRTSQNAFIRLFGSSILKRAYMIHLFGAIASKCPAIYV